MIKKFVLVFFFSAHHKDEHSNRFFPKTIHDKQKVHQGIPRTSLKPTLEIYKGGTKQLKIECLDADINEMIIVGVCLKCRKWCWKKRKKNKIIYKSFN